VVMPGGAQMHQQHRGSSHRGSGGRYHSGARKHDGSGGHYRGRGGRGKDGNGGGGSYRGRHKKGSHGGHGGNPQRTNEDSIKRTVYICDIDNQVTEAQLAAVFIDSGPVIDCRVCGDPNSAMRFAFIEFEDEESAKNALVKNGTVLGLYPLKVQPSRTAIVPVNLQYLPSTYEEREQCGRTVYAANIDKKVDRNDVRAFFETLCGRVSKLRLLGDYQHATRICFVEFFKAESAIAALNCSGALLGSLPIRVSPSKTPVRPDPRDASANSGNGKEAAEGDSEPSSANGTSDAKGKDEAAAQAGAGAESDEKDKADAGAANGNGRSHENGVGASNSSSSSDVAGMEASGAAAAATKSSDAGGKE